MHIYLTFGTISTAIVLVFDLKTSQVISKSVKTMSVVRLYLLHVLKCTCHIYPHFVLNYSILVYIRVNYSILVHIVKMQQIIMSSCNLKVVTA